MNLPVIESQLAVFVVPGASHAARDRATREQDSSAF